MYKRQGVTAADAMGFEAVVEAIARERGGVPGLWKPLGRLLGSCHDDGPCREQLLAEAEAAAGEAGLVPVLEVLTAGTLGDLDDPAFATALLFADELLAGSSPEQLAALLEALQPGLTAEETRRVLRAEAGVGAQRVDRSLRRRVDAGRRDRLGR